MKRSHGVLLLLLAALALFLVRSSASREHESDVRGLDGPHSASPGASAAALAEVTADDRTERSTRGAPPRTALVPLAAGGDAGPEPSVLLPPPEGVSASRGSILVQARRKQTLTPVSGVVVALSGPEDRRASVDPLGEVRFDRLTPGHYMVGVEATSLPVQLAPSAFDVQTSVWLARAGLSGGTSVQVSPGQQRHVDLRVAAGGAVRGRVTGESGHGVAEVELWFWPESRGTHLAITSTSATGEFHQRLPTGAYTVEIQRAPHLASTITWPAPEDLRIEAGRVRELDFSLEPGPHVAFGSVVDELGTPYAGLDVHLYHPLRGDVRAQARSTTTNPDGTFRFENLRAETLELELGIVQGRCSPLRPAPVVAPSGLQSTVDLGVLQAKRLPGFTVHLSLSVDPLWRAAMPFAELTWSARARSSEGQQLPVHRVFPTTPEQSDFDSHTFYMPEPEGTLHINVHSSAGARLDRSYEARPGLFVNEHVRFP